MRRSGQYFLNWSLQFNGGFLPTSYVLYITMLYVQLCLFTSKQHFVLLNFLRFKFKHSLSTHSAFQNHAWPYYTDSPSLSPQS